MIILRFKGTMAILNSLTGHYPSYAQSKSECIYNFNCTLKAQYYSVVINIKMDTALKGLSIWSDSSVVVSWRRLVDDICSKPTLMDDVKSI